MPIGGDRVHNLIPYGYDEEGFRHYHVIIHESNAIVTRITSDDVVTVALCFLGRALGFDVTAHGGSVTVNAEGTDFTFADGSYYVIINGEYFLLLNDRGEPTPAVQTGEHLFIPLYNFGRENPFVNFTVRRNYYTHTAYLYVPRADNNYYYYCNEEIPEFIIGMVRVQIGRYEVNRLNRRIYNNVVTYSHVFDVPPDVYGWISEHDATMIPLRFVSYALELDVHWDGEARIATIDGNGRNIQFAPGATYAILNGTPFPIRNGRGEPIEAVLRNDRIFIPLRTLGEILQMPVAWNPHERYAHLYVVHDVNYFVN
jgi:hypothetical protein